MNKRIYRLTGLILLLGLAACASGDGENSENHKVNTAKPESDLKIVRGHYVFGHEVRALSLCGEDEALWVVDRTNLLKDLHSELTPGAVPYEEVFVTAAGRIGPPLKDGFGADYPGTLTIEDVIYVAFEGFGCDFDWNRFIYRAQGNEPFWTVAVLATEMRLTRPGHPTLTWTDVSEKQTGDAVIFHASGGGHSPVELVIETGPSRDTMSGAYYGLSARLTVGDETFTGHALRGIGAESHVR